MSSTFTLFLLVGAWMTGNAWVSPPFVYHREVQRASSAAWPCFRIRSGPIASSSRKISMCQHAHATKHLFKIGDPVQCCWPTAADAEYPGDVLRLNPDGTYGIKYRLDDTFEASVAEDRLTAIDVAAIEAAQALEFARPDDIEDGLPPIEEGQLLDEYRAVQLEVNDNWHFSQFRKFQAGDWFGYAEEWKVKLRESDGPSFIKQEDKRKIRWTTEIIGEAVRDDGRTGQADPDIPRQLKILTRDVTDQEDTAGSDDDDDVIPPPSLAEYLPSNFRRDQGNQACANGFTFSSGDPAVGFVTHELGLSGGDGTRVRALFSYERAGVVTSDKAEEAEEGSSGGSEELGLSTLCVIRERVNDWPTGDEAGFAGTEQGNGLFARHVLEDQKSPNVDLALSGGRLTVSMPLTLSSDDTKAWSIDWTPSRLRMQLDRTYISGPFEELHSLELTEIEA